MQWSRADVLGSWRQCHVSLTGRRLLGLTFLQQCCTRLDADSYFCWKRVPSRRYSRCIASQCPSRRYGDSHGQRRALEQAWQCYGCSYRYVVQFCAQHADDPFYSAGAVWSGNMPLNLRAQLSPLGLTAAQIQKIFGSIRSARLEKAEVRAGVLRGKSRSQNVWFI